MRGRRTATAAFSATVSACASGLPAHMRRRGDGESSGGGCDDPAGRHRSAGGFTPPQPGAHQLRTPAAAGDHLPGQRQQNALETCARSMWRRRVRSTRGFMEREFSRRPPRWSITSRTGLALRTRRTPRVFGTRPRGGCRCALPRPAMNTRASARVVSRSSCERSAAACLSCSSDRLILRGLGGGLAGGRLRRSSEPDGRWAGAREGPRILRSASRWCERLRGGHETWKVP